MAERTESNCEIHRRLRLRRGAGGKGKCANPLDSTRRGFEADELCFFLKAITARHGQHEHQQQQSTQAAAQRGKVQQEPEPLHAVDVNRAPVLTHAEHQKATRCPNPTAATQPALSPSRNLFHPAPITTTTILLLTASLSRRPATPSNGITTSHLFGAQSFPCLLLPGNHHPRSRPNLRRRTLIPRLLLSNRLRRCPSNSRCRPFRTITSRAAEPWSQQDKSHIQCRRIR